MRGEVEKRSALSTTPTGLPIQQDFHWSRRFQLVGARLFPLITSQSSARLATPPQIPGDAV